MVKQAKCGKRVVRLMAGDPFVYASGPEEAQACVKAGVGFEIVPGVSSVTAVPAYAGRAADRQEAPRGRGRELLRDAKIDWSQYADDRTLVLLSAVGSIGEVAKALVAAGPQRGHPGRDDPGRHHHRAGDHGLHARRRGAPTPAPRG